MNTRYENYKTALKSAPSPALWLDLDLFEANIQWALQHAGGKKLRVASKSLRSVELIRRVLKSSPVFQGIMSFTLPEALWLRSLGFQDILMGYPTTDLRALAELARNPQDITLMVDRPEHIEMLGGLSGSFSICLDIDLSLDLPFVRFGVYRSAITDLATLSRVLDVLARHPQIKLVGVMGYEAQIAGVMDKHSLLMRLLKRISIGKLRHRREAMVKLIQARGHQLKFVNGGGTGSLQSTNQEAVVTEVTVGSAFYAPVLFDHYQDFTLGPAMGFTVPVVRAPKAGMITCLGGGYIASGETGVIKSPTPYLPPGLRLEKNEGTGEVQTPMYLPSGLTLNVGDLVFMRHAKAGEACERFNEIHLIRGDQHLGTCPTYRGDGKAFL